MAKAQEVRVVAEGKNLTVKLHINISQGLIEVEGDADFVKEIYSDFRDQLLNGERAPAPSPLNQETAFVP